MSELLTAAQMRSIEATAIESGEVTGLELMERAGRGVVEAILEEWPELAMPGKDWRFWRKRPNRKAVILCGPGNNGGDGFVIARLLSQRGWAVQVYLFGDPEQLPVDAKSNYDRWRGIGPCDPFTDSKSRDARLCSPHPDLWIDAIFGIGQTRALPDIVSQMLHRVYYEQNWSDAPVVAVDLPSGISSDTGEELQNFMLCADLTVTFHGLKRGHMDGNGPSRCGKVVVCDIGL